MDARPTLEQRELAAAAAQLADKLGPGTVGDLDDRDRRGRLDQALTQAGWRELRTGSVDTPLASGVEAALVARELARRVCDTSFIGPVLAHDLLRHAGVDPGEPARTVALTRDLRRPAAGVDGVAIDAAGSTAALALTAGELVEHRLASDEWDAGVDITRVIRPVDGTPGDVLGTLDDDALIAWDALAVTLTAADLVGAMEGALELATEYAKDRRQYGAPIGSFQAVQHLLAEARTLAEGSVSAMTYAAWAVDALAPGDARAAAAVAKAYTSRAARTVCETAIQVHGGIGNTWECMAHVYLRRVLVSTELFGGEDAQLRLLASERIGGDHGLS